MYCNSCMNVASQPDLSFSNSIHWLITRHIADNTVYNMLYGIPPYIFDYYLLVLKTIVGPDSFRWQNTLGFMTQAFRYGLVQSLEGPEELLLSPLPSPFLCSLQLLPRPPRWTATEVDCCSLRAMDARMSSRRWWASSWTSSSHSFCPLCLGCSGELHHLWWFPTFLSTDMTWAAWTRIQPLELESMNSC